MGSIARLTTPAFSYKPSAVSINEIAKIFLVLKQDGVAKVTKTIEDAIVSEDKFTWVLSQEETRILILGKTLLAQVDYLTNGGARYTTAQKTYSITDSAINEVI